MLRWRPGVYVVRRDATHLQAGIDPPYRVIVPDTPEVRAALRDLPAESERGPEARAAVRAMRAAGLLLDGGEPGSASGIEPAARRAAEAQFGEDAARRLTARAAVRVAVRADHALRTSAERLLRTAGLGPPADGGLPGVWLVVTTGEPARDEIDPLVHEGVPHLLVSVGATARIGPFVVPGATACLRCVDAALAEADPRRPLVVEQTVRAAQQARDAAVDPTLAMLALAWAVRDLSRYAEGDHPMSWSAVVEIDHASTAVRHEWRRHPHCGCAWDVVS